ncbi:MAG: hypothetical protein ACI841_002076 [Planctomycetota bacterium]|jgi:hypothetical protein
MKTSLPSLALASLALIPLFASCSTHSHMTKFNGVNGLRGEPVEYQSTSTWALHFLFAFGVAGDASKGNTISEFTKEASARGGTRVRIAETSSSTYWWIFPPISFLLHPVQTTVNGDVEGSVAPEE